VKKKVGKPRVSKETKIREKETPQKLLDVAMDLFAANGFKGTSIRDIARETGMTISGIYYYFHNKEGLLYAILEKSANNIVEKLRLAVENDLEPLERFKLLLKTHFDLLIGVYMKESKILWIEAEELTRVSKQYQIEILNIYRQELKKLKELGYIKYNNVTILAFNIFAVINWHLRWYKPEGRLSLAELCEEMVNFVLHGAFGNPHSWKGLQDK
jgi:AcrR family transcriptional regulator